MANGQLFKSIYFPDYKVSGHGAKGFALAFSEPSIDLFRGIEHLASNEVRNLLDTDSFAELKSRAKAEGLPINTYCLWYLRKKLQPLELPLDVPETRVKSLNRLENQVFEGDCLQLLPKIPSRSIDMVLCDLPYGTTQNKWDSVIPLHMLWQHYERIIKESGVIALTSQGLFTAKVMLSNPRLFKYKITWVKSKPTNFLNAKKQPLRRHEDICIFYNKQPAYNPQMSLGEPYNKGFRKNQLTGSYGDFRVSEVKSDGERYPTDVVYFKTAESEGKVLHPTQKPVELGRYLIRTYTNQNDVVLDNACGSGSFLVSAVLEGRRYIGIEKNQDGYLHKKSKVDYVEICKQRVKNAKKQYETKMPTLL